MRKVKKVRKMPHDHRDGISCLSRELPSPDQPIPSEEGGNSCQNGGNFRLLFHPASLLPLPSRLTVPQFRQGLVSAAKSYALLCRYSSGPCIAHSLSMLHVRAKDLSAKEKTMTPLMLITLISLAPFPILSVALLAGRWLKPHCQSVVIAHAAYNQNGPYR